MDGVRIEPNGIRDFYRHWPNLCFDSERLQRGHKFVVEVGYATGLKIEQFRLAPACFDAQDMFGEIKFRLENASAVGNRGGRQASGAHIEGNFPPMIQMTAERQPNFANDLSPHV